MLKRVSLVALLAMGLGSFASAGTPLTEAIKSVDVSGMLRARFYHERHKQTNADGTTGHVDYNRWRTNAILKFTVHADENLDFVWRTSVQSDNYSDATAPTDHKSDGDGMLKSNLLFLNYKYGNFGLIGGKIPVKTPITSADPATPAHGAGLIATFQPVEGLTLAGGWVDKLVHASTDDDAYVGKVLDRDIFTVAGSYEAKNKNWKAELWLFRITKALTYDAVFRAFYKYPVGNGEFVKISADYAQAKNDEHIDAEKNTHRYYHIGVEGKVAGFNAGAGYAGTNKKAGAVELSEDSPLANVLPVEQRYSIANDTDTKAWYLKAGYDVNPQISLGAGFAKVWQGKEYGDVDSIEWKVGGTYKYNNKVSFNAYFDDLVYSANANKAGHPNNQEIRLEALYKF